MLLNSIQLIELPRKHFPCFNINLILSVFPPSFPRRILHPVFFDAFVCIKTFASIYQSSTIGVFLHSIVSIRLSLPVCFHFHYSLIPIEIKSHDMESKTKRGVICEWRSVTPPTFFSLV